MRSTLDLIAQVALTLLAFAVVVGLAVLAGAPLGSAATIGQLAFAAALVAALVRWPRRAG